MRSLKVRKGEEWYAGECDSLVNSGRVWRSLRKTVMFDGGQDGGSTTQHGDQWEVFRTLGLSRDP